MKTLPGKKTAANTITVVGLFLFSIGAFNLPGQIFFALTLSYFIWKSKVIVFQKQELALLLFSASYFIIYTFHFGFAVKVSSSICGDLGQHSCLASGSSSPSVTRMRFRF